MPRTITATPRAGPPRSWTRSGSSLRPLNRLFGPTPAKDFGEDQLEAVRQSMIDAGLSRRTINERTARIVRALGFGVRKKLFPAETTSRSGRSRGSRRAGRGVREGRTVRPAPEAHVEAVRPHVSRQVWAMVELQRLTGMRSGEVDDHADGRHRPLGAGLGLHPGLAQDRAPRQGADDLPRPPGAGGPPALAPGRRGRIPLPAPGGADAERRAERRAARKTPVDALAAGPDAEGPAEEDARASATARGPIRHAIERACKRAGVPHWHPHQLRHNAATWLRKEFGLDVARVILGHTSPAVTETYAEADREKAVRVMRETG